MELSRDGPRVYVTNSFYGAWDGIFYPEGVGAWLVKLDADTTSGGMTADRVSSPTGTRSEDCGYTRPG